MLSAVDISEGMELPSTCRTISLYVMRMRGTVRIGFLLDRY